MKKLPGILWLVFGLVNVGIYVADLLHWTPKLLHPTLHVSLAIGSIAWGAIRLRRG